MALIFNLAYQEKMDKGGHWVFNKTTIAVHYLRRLLRMEPPSRRG